MGIAESMELFVNPQSVAIIGASRRTGRGSFNVAENLLELGFKGQIYPVNPNMDSVSSLKVYPSVEALPLGIDLGIPHDSGCEDILSLGHDEMCRHPELSCTMHEDDYTAGYNGRSRKGYGNFGSRPE